MTDNNVRDLTEVMAERVLKEHLNVKLVSPELIAALSEAMKSYADTLTQHATRDIIKMSIQLNGYENVGKTMWKILHDLNTLRIYYMEHPGHEDVVESMNNVFKSLGLKVEGRDINAPS